MAIAHDADSNAGNIGNASSATWSHTVTGSNPILWMGFAFNNGYNAPTVSSVTYAGASMTLAQTVALGAPDYWVGYLYYKLGPPTGANNVVVTLSKTIGTANQFFAAASSFTGANQSGLDNSGTTATASAANGISTSLTTVNANAWIMDLTITGDGNGPTTQINANSPQSRSFTSVPLATASLVMGMSYQGPIVTPASTSDGYTTNMGTNQDWGLVMASFKGNASTATLRELLLLGVGK